MIGYAKHTFNIAKKEMVPALTQLRRKDKLSHFFITFRVGRTEDICNVIAYHVTCLPSARVMTLSLKGLNVVFKCSRLFVPFVRTSNPLCHNTDVTFISYKTPPLT